MGQTIQQQRAAFALHHVQLAVENDEISNKEFKSYASSLPSMIYMNGLGQAVAFCRSKSSNTAYQVLYNILSEWLHKKAGVYREHADVLDGITQSDMSSYRLAQVESLALFDWIKKFATAYCQE